MNPQFLIAKLAANATEKSWAQAYSTLNFYVALNVSVEEVGEKPIAQIGKELLERLQREYFSLDEKSSESIKSAVESTVKTIDSTVKHSLILATNSQDTLHIVTSGTGSVAIKRGEKFGFIAQGKPNEILSFSGPLQDNDILLVQTDDFSHKITPQVLAPHLQTNNVTEISEDIAPLLHENPSGGEAVVILQYSDPESSVLATEQDEDTLPSKEQTDTTSTTTEDDYTEESVTELLSGSSPEKKRPVPSINITGIKNAVATLRSRKKMLLGILIIALVILLIGSIFVRSRQEQSADNSAAIEQAVTTANTEYEEGVALEPLNRPLALEKFMNAQELLNNTKNKYPDDDNIEQVNSLLSKVENKLSELSSGEKVENGQEIATADSLDLSELQTVTAKGGTVIVTDKSSALVTVSSGGEAEDSYELDTQTIVDSTSNSDFAFILTDSGVVRVDLGNGNENELFEVDSARQGIDIFGSNIYLLNRSDNMIEKYSPSSYAASDYLEEQLSDSPLSFGIDGSVYILLESGKIGKFTRGVDDGFNVTGMQGAVSKNSQVFSAEEFTYVYILDKTNERILITGKNGEVKQEFSWDIISEAVDFSVDEGAKTIYIATPDTLYSFEF